MFNNIEVSRAPWPPIGNFSRRRRRRRRREEEEKINLAPIDLLASPQVKKEERSPFNLCLSQSSRFVIPCLVQPRALSSSLSGVEVEKYPVSLDKLMSTLSFGQFANVKYPQSERTHDAHDVHPTDMTSLALCTAAATELLKRKLYSLRELFLCAEEMDLCVVVCHKDGNGVDGLQVLGMLLHTR